MSESHRTIHVNIPGAEYDVMVQPGLLADCGRILCSLSKSKRAGVISDQHVAPLYADSVCKSLQQAGFEPIQAIIPPGEENKTIQSVANIYDRLLSAGIERSTPLLALGGGIVGDMTGFAAATILRGVPFVQVPTSLLAMVDASVGGKTGVNHPVGKNLIGAFHQPMAVLIDPQTLRTLPARELRSGLAECIKHDIIRDAEAFAALEQNIHRAMEVDVPYLADLVAHNVAIKARVVESDPFEKAERAHLNFGHTFGHAIETISNYAYSHGEAVALGMVAASRLAERLGMINAASVARIVKVIEKAGLPTGGMTLPVDPIVAALLFDKKVKAGRVRFVLPDRIGHVIMRDDVPPDRVTEAVESLQ